MNQWKMIFVLTEKGKTMTDYIKREDAMDAVEKHYDDGVGKSVDTILIMDEIAIDIENNIPSADVAEVQHGKWNNHKDEHVCSICKDVVIADWTYDYDELVYDYCPHCGARMDGEK